MNRKQGFTLIELMVVIAKGRDNTRKANLRAITNALELYLTDKGTYPLGQNGAIEGCEVLGAPAPCADGIFQDAKGTLYMAQLPTDPLKDSQKYYYVSTDGKQYQIYAHLENTQDPQCLQINCPSNGLLCGTNAGFGCNYGISSANTTP